MAIATGPERILWGLLALLVVGYMVGTWLNRQRGKYLGTWLQAGVTRLGGKPAWKIVRSISSGGQVTVGEAVAPFRQVQINYAMLTREFAPLWAYEYLRGRRDLLVLRAILRSEPACELEVLPGDGSLAAKLNRAAGERPWTWQDGPAGLRLATRGTANTRLLAAARKFLDRYGPSVERLSLRSSAIRAAGGLALPAAGPAATRWHLRLFLNLGEAEHAPAAALLEAVRDVARAV